MISKISCSIFYIVSKYNGVFGIFLQNISIYDCFHFTLCQSCFLSHCIHNQLIVLSKILKWIFIWFLWKTHQFNKQNQVKYHLWLQFLLEIFFLYVFLHLIYQTMSAKFEYCGDTIFWNRKKKRRGRKLEIILNKIHLSILNAITLLSPKTLPTHN